MYERRKTSDKNDTFTTASSAEENKQGDRTTAAASNENSQEQDETGRQALMFE